MSVWGIKKYLLTTKLAGEEIQNEHKLDEAWFFKFGKIIADLHVAFQQCEETMSFWNNSMLEEMKGWVSEKLEKYRPDYLKAEDIQGSVDELEKVYKDLPKQLIHRDVHVGNFLFKDESFTGYIDFDLSQRNIRIFDICYFLLGTICKESGNRHYDQRWFKQVGAVCKGYNSVLELTDTEKKSIACVMKNIELLFVAYFLGQKDDVLARDAAALFDFVRVNEAQINAAVSA